LKTPQQHCRTPPHLSTSSRVVLERTLLLPCPFKRNPESALPPTTATQHRFRAAPANTAHRLLATDCSVIPCYRSCHRSLAI
jgi:hypothetical protein